MANQVFLFRCFAFLRLLGRFALLVYFVAGIGLLGLRYWLLPNADQWRGAIESQLSDALGASVSLGEIKAQWLGANPRLTLSDVVLKDEDQAEMLRLPYLNAVLSWRGALGGKLQFASLQASGLDLTVRRDPQGHVWVAGQSFDPAADSGRPDAIAPALAWLSLQRRVLLTDMTLRWHDETRSSRTLVLEQARVQIDNSGRERRFSLSAIPADGVASAIDIRGELRSPSRGVVERVGQLSGRIYANVQAWQPVLWRPWLDLPARLESGVGSAQASLTFSEGKPGHLAFDASVRQARWRLAALDHVSIDAARLHMEGQWEQFLALAPAGAAPAGSPGQAVDFQLQGKGVTAVVADAYAHPLHFDDAGFRGAAGHAAGGRLQIRLEHAEVSNAELAMRLQGTWGPAAGSAAGVADFSGSVSRFSAPAIVRYLPEQVSQDARAWMRDGLTHGDVRNAGFVLKGNLDHFPFGEQPDAGEFRLEGVLGDVQIDYVPATAGRPGWPRLEALQGTLVMDRASLRIHASEGQMYPSRDLPALALREIDAFIPDIEHDPLLTVKGETSGDAASYLALMPNSPLGKLIGGVLDEATATGQWAVPLELSIPLMHSADTAVNGSIRFGEGGSVHLMPEMPVLDQVSGVLAFSDTAIGANAIQGRFLGGPVTLAGGIGDGQDGLRLSGSMRSGALKSYVGVEGMDRLDGSASYTAVLRRDRNGVFSIEAESSLEGMALRLPEPLGKSAAAASPLRVRWGAHAGAADTMALDIGLGDTTRVRALRRSRQADGAYFHAVGIGHGQPLPDVAAGSNVDASIAEFDAKVWEDLVTAFSTRIEGAHASGIAAQGRPLLPALRRLRVQADRGSIFGLRTTQLTLTASRENESNVRMDISSTETAGTLFWREANGKVEGNVQARLDRLSIGGGQQAGADAQGGAEPVQGALVQDELDIPAIDLTVGRFTLYGRMLGALEARGVNEERGKLWRLDRFRISGPGASLEGTGSWSLAGGERGMHLDATIQVDDLGAYFDQIGFQGTMQGGQGEIKADLFWGNLPWSLEIADIRGTLELALEKGRFNHVNSRVARLLELLSLQSVKRLARLDFNLGGLVKDGFPYDVLRGELALEQGELSTRDYRVIGPVGTIVIDGKVHLLRQTLDLQAAVIPNLDVSGAAIAAGIAVNPIVGVGAFLTQWLLQAPLSKAMTVQYRVSGQWDDPVVDEVASVKEDAGVPEPVAH